MKKCSSCKKINPEDANYCQHCGEKLDSPTSKSTFKENINHFEEEIEDFGKKIEESVEKAGKHIETWYDKTFGISGPFLSALIAFVIFFLFFSVLSFFSEKHLWLQDVKVFLEPLLLVILIIFLLSSYSQYFAKKIKSFRFVSPIIGAIMFIVWFWIAINILSIIATTFDLPMVQTFTNLFKILLFPLAVLIILIGYLGVIFSTRQWETSEKDLDDTVSDQAKRQETREHEEFKRLYRSGKDHLVGGVLGGIAEYLTVDPIIIRILYILLLFASFGFMILAYLIGWMLIPRNPDHKW